MKSMNERILSKLNISSAHYTRKNSYYTRIWTNHVNVIRKSDDIGKIGQRINRDFRRIDINLSHTFSTSKHNIDVKSTRGWNNSLSLIHDGRVSRTRISRSRIFAFHGLRGRTSSLVIIERRENGRLYVKLYGI